MNENIQATDLSNLSESELKKKYAEVQEQLLRIETQILIDEYQKELKDIDVKNIENVNKVSELMEKYQQKHNELLSKRRTTIHHNIMENTEYKKQLNDVISHLFKEMSQKHQIDEDMILLQYQDNILSICEQDYENLKVLEQIDFNEITQQK